MKLVLLHSPLVGPSTWQPIAPLLRQRGFEIALVDFVPAMTGNPPYYERLVSAAALASDHASKNILVVHSGAGSLVPAIAKRASVAGAIFVDALMPHPRQSWFETIPPSLKVGLTRLAHDDRVPPWHRWWPDGTIRSLFVDETSYVRFVSELREIPLAYLDEPAPDCALGDDFIGAYLQLGAGNAAEASVAERLGWPVKRLALHHLALLTHPEDVAGGIANLARLMQR